MTTTCTTLYNGRLQVRQPVSGYRFSMDAVLLGQWARLNPSDRVLDLGCGCGIISLILAHRYSNARIFGVEIQPELAEIAACNIAENNLQQRITLFQQDMNELTPAMTSGPVDAVVCNPPHRRAESGRINPDMGLAIARHEITMTSDTLMAAAERMLTAFGRLMTIYPAERLTEILEKMRALHLEPKRLTLIHTRPQGDARRFLVEGIKGGRPGMTVTPPIQLNKKINSRFQMLKGYSLKISHNPCR